MPAFDDRTKQVYQGSSGRAYHEGKRSIPEQAVPWVAKLRARKIAPHVSGHDVVFEFGAGYGWNLTELICSKRIAYEVTEFLVPVLRERGIDTVNDPAAIEAGAIDVTICHHTLEHTPDPADVLGTLHRLLKPGGKLLLFVPYEKERRYRRYNPAELNRHLFSWNVQTLARLVETAGFEVRQAHLGNFGQERFAARWAARFALGEIGFRLLQFTANFAKHEQEVRVVGIKRET